MIYFKDSENNIYAYEENTPSNFLENKINELGLISINKEDVDLIQKLNENEELVRSRIIDILYSVRNEYIYKNISYNNFEFIADSQAQNKIANMIFFALQVGKTDTDPVADWDCVNGEYQDITLADLKNIAQLMVTQEQTARAILRVLKSKYNQASKELLINSDVEQDFENMWNAQTSLG
ncbi:DUF4376 domain-containing protein [Francisella marina]|uniref:DUF4376 domain-containing protein n=1 Tax=Francisella marina TaxID=2249302 RepID=A0ABX5ZGR4_9GAMM|nr:hypothetical protein [Francisella marina]QEO57547.1 hypothetical protein F0R74_06665 [Francisella marina]